jgi:hypothetical protein
MIPRTGKPNFGQALLGGIFRVEPGVVGLLDPAYRGA